MTQHRDMTPLADPTWEHGSGAVRTRQPRYVSPPAPCNNVCPAGEDVQAWLALAQAGRFQKARLKLMEENPLPSVHGRVCYHPFETSCNRGALDSAVRIHAAEHFLGDMAAEEGIARGPLAQSRNSNQRRA